jgi:cyclopropane fatty-acyl-phospholipid synthase-like methyltransferase
MHRMAGDASPTVVGAHYDTLDRQYRTIWGEHVHHGYWVSGRETAAQATRALVSLVATAAEIQPGARVCDVGCGYGASDRMLALEYGAHVTGLTISAAQHRHALASGGATDNPRILRRDWLDNGLGGSEFDAVIAIESVSHMGDRAAVFAECQRVLVPGGRLVVLDWLAAATATRWQQARLLEPICRHGRLAGLGTLAGYGEELVAAGFDEVRGRDISSHVWRTWPTVVARSALRLPRDPELRRMLRDRLHPEHGFAAMVACVMAGYATRAFRYGMLTARKPRGG